MMPGTPQQSMVSQAPIFPTERRANYEIEDDEGRKIALPDVPDRCGPPSISLAQLLDFAIQHTYHELTVLTELLPKKNDAARKISIVQFAHSTRLKFVKLLAIVKWVKMSKKFDALPKICYFLDQQAMYFIDTADKLVELARSELVGARLPTFQVPSAVDVMTLGTFPRLPTCIKDRFIPEKKLTDREQARTLKRLNQVIQNRICLASSKMSPRITDVVIKNGMVTLTVPGEFEASLTVLGEDKSINWTLLNIRILVEDYEIGQGTKLVHPLQLNMMHQLIQSRIESKSNIDAINEVYSVLHSFAQSLQVDVLYCQTCQLIQQISPNFLKVEKYDKKATELVVSYWLSKSANKLMSHYRVHIFADKDNPNAGLRVRHYPYNPRLPLIDERTGRLSMNKLLSETIAIRCEERLLRIRKLLELLDWRPGAKLELSGDTFLSLTYPLLVEPTPDRVHHDENLVISINRFFGTVLCQVKALGSRPEITELEKQLFEGASIEVIQKTIERLRILIMINRYNEAISGLQVRHVTEAQMVPHLVQLKNLPVDRICLQFTKEEQYYLVVTFEIDVETGVKVEFYLISNTHGKANMQRLDPDDIAKMTSVPHFIHKTKESEKEAKQEPVGVVEKRYQECRENSRRWIGGYKRLQAAVACIDDRLAFLRICEELEKRGVKYEPLTTEPIVGGLILRITSFKDNPNIAQIDADDFFDNLKNCCLRLDARRAQVWPFECTMKNSPVVSDFNDNLPTINSGEEKRDPTKHSHPSNRIVPIDFPYFFDCIVTFNLVIFIVNPEPDMAQSMTFVQDIGGGAGSTSISENVSSNVIDRMSIYCNLYAPVKRFSRVYDTYFKQFCSVQAYTYHKIVIAYGDNRDQILVLSWKPAINAFKVNFGQYLPKHIANRETLSAKPDRIHKQWNPHIMVSNILNEKFNKDRDLIYLINYIINTHKVLAALYNFSKMKLRSLKSYSQIMAVDPSQSTFPIELQVYESAIDENTVHLVYGPVHLEFLLLSDNRCAIRDSSPKIPMAFGLEAFWKKHYGGDLPRFKKPMPSTSGFASLGGPITPQTTDITANSPYTMPMSVDRHMLAHQKNRSPMASHSLSVPPPASAMEEDINRVGSSMSVDRLPTTKELLVLDSATLERAMTPPDDPFVMSPLEAYLFAISYIQRTGKALETYRKRDQRDQLPIKELHAGLSSLAVVVQGAPHPHLKHEPWTVKLSLFVCPQTFQLRAKLNFSGVNAPPEADIKIAEKYFEDCVSRLCNEYAVIAFMTTCRLDGPGTFESLVQVMKFQMEPDLQYHWKINLQLVDSNKATTPASAQRKFESSIILNEACTNALITVCIRPQRLIGPEKCTEQRIFQLVYNIQNNDLRVRNANSDEEKALHTILLEQSQRSQQVNECCIWPCLRMALEKFHSSTIGSSGGLSVLPMSQQQPGSVGTLGSVGPMSNAMLNPGSNQPR